MADHPEHEHNVRCLIRALTGDFSEAAAALDSQPSLLNAKTDGAGETALHWLVIENRQRGVEFLIQRGAAVDEPTHGGETPLMSAARAGHLELCKLLIGAGADVNAADENADTVLHHAAQSEHDDIVRLLLRAGADPSVSNTLEETPADLASPKIRQVIDQFTSERGNSAV